MRYEVKRRQTAFSTLPRSCRPAAITRAGAVPPRSETFKRQMADRSRDRQKVRGSGRPEQFSLGQTWFGTLVAKLRSSRFYRQVVVRVHCRDLALVPGSEAMLLNKPVNMPLCPRIRRSGYPSTPYGWSHREIPSRHGALAHQCIVLASAPQAIYGFRRG